LYLPAAVIELEPQVRAHVGADSRRLPVLPVRGDVAAEVAVEQRRQHEQQQREREDPREQHVPVACRAEAVVARDRRPSGKRTTWNHASRGEKPHWPQ
jgi:hypothetical protein